jgi:hypothetical protein
MASIRGNSSSNAGLLVKGALRIQQSPLAPPAYVKRLLGLQTSLRELLIGYAQFLIILALFKIVD